MYMCRAICFTFVIAIPPSMWKVAEQFSLLLVYLVCFVCGLSFCTKVHLLQVTLQFAMWPHKDAIQRHTFGQDVQGLHHHPGNPNGSCLQTTAHQWSIYLFCSQSKALRLLDVNNALWALPSEKKQLYQRMLQHITDKQCLLCVCLWNISHDYQSLSLCTLKEFSWSN